MEGELKVGRNLPSGPSCGPGGEIPGVGRGGKVTLVRRPRPLGAHSQASRTRSTGDWLGAGGAQSPVCRLHGDRPRGASLTARPGFMNG